MLKEGDMKKFKKLIKKILRSKFFLPVLEKYIASKISKINLIPDPRFGILVLDVERFWPGGLERLGEEVQLYVLPHECRNFLHSLFFVSEEVSMLRHYNVDDDFILKEREFVSFLRLLIPRLASHLGFDCVLTCNYMYIQNKLIAKACKATHIPFVDLNRESKQDTRFNDKWKRKYETLNLHTRFFGNAICVYNENMKRLLCDLDVCCPEDIYVTGALQTDTLLKRVSETKNTDTCKQVTLFSFRHMPVSGDNIGYDGGFCPDGTRGFITLFNNVHSAFAKLAKDNPTIRFVIKLKWSNDWQDYVRGAVEKSGSSLEELDNLVVAGEDEDAMDLILASHFVVGLNSTTMLQARMANKVVIVPYFGEIVDKYPENLQYRDVLSEFVLARSPEEFVLLIQEHITGPISLLPPSPGIFDEYIGFSDGKNLERVLSVLSKECDKAKKSAG